ncbi:MAG: tryptophan-rich sensory protein [Oscillospiraceae bacterium]|nr:tryptophan-rich sensory protein [Oscillospiraceae bacterium]
MFKAINLKKMFFSVLIVELIGAVSLIIASGARGMWNDIITPDLALSLNALIIMWFAVLAMMGVALYFAKSSKNGDKIGGWFWLQLIFACLWPIWFFNLRAFGFASIWLLILVALIGITIKKFAKASKGAGVLLIPYLLFIIYMLYLNYGILMLN